MATFEDNTHVFIVRIWSEPREIEDAPVEWRGVVEHLFSGDKHYLKDLAEIITFIAQHTEELQVEIEPNQPEEPWSEQQNLSLKNQN